MRGNITRRGRRSWRLKYDVGVGPDGKRQIVYKTVKGTRKNAETELARLLTDLAQGRYIARSIETVETYARHWLTNIAPSKSGPSSLAQYESVLRTHILPELGAIELQKLDGGTIDRLYAHCRERGLAPVTVGNLHAMLKRILKSAVKAGKLASSPMERVQTAPNAKSREVEVLDEEQIGRLLHHLNGHWLYLPTLLTIHTGLRRGEVCGLRWKDLNSGRLQVTQAIGRVGNKIGVTTLKTKRSRRSVTLPAGLLADLAGHKKVQAVMRLRLGLGKDAADLMFTMPDGKPLHPVVLSHTFAQKVREAGLPPTKFHGLRHFHVSYLLKSGVPVHVVSARAGHANASVTLNTYAHLIGGEDERAAEQADKLFEAIRKK
jgi:integrase